MIPAFPSEHYVIKIKLVGEGTQKGQGGNKGAIRCFYNSLTEGYFSLYCSKWGSLLTTPEQLMNLPPISLNVCPHSRLTLLLGDDAVKLCLPLALLPPPALPAE